MDLLQQSNRRTVTSLSPEVQILELDQDIEVGLLEKLTIDAFDDLKEQGYIPALSIELLNKIICLTDESSRQRILFNLTKSRNIIKPTGKYQTVDGVITDEMIKSYKYLKGMMTYLKICTYFNQTNNTNLLYNSRNQDKYVFNSMDVCKELNHKFHINIDSERTIQFACNPSANYNISKCSKLNIDKKSYEDFIYFYYIWYSSIQPKDCFRLNSLLEGFDYTYDSLKTVIEKYLGIFDIYLTDYNSDITSFCGGKKLRESIEKTGISLPLATSNMSIMQPELEIKRRRDVIL